MNKFSNKNYEHLEGKMVLVEIDKAKIPLIIAGIEYDIGITLAEIDGQAKICLKPWANIKAYTASFFHIVSQLKKGRLNYNKAIKMEAKIRKIPFINDARNSLEEMDEICPFRQ